MNFHEDPRFRELSPEDQQKILGVAFDEEVASDPRFSVLPEEDQAKIQSIYFQNYLGGAPGASEETTSSRGIGGFLKDTAIDAVKGIVGTGESVVGLLDMATGNLVGKGLASIGYDPKATNEILSSGYTPQRKAENIAVEQADGFVGTLEALVDHPAVAFGSIIESAPMSLGGAAVARRLATGMLARGLAAEGLTAGTPKAVEYASKLFADPKVRATLTAAGAATEGAQAAGSIQEQARQEGVPWSQSVLPAAAAGIGTAAIGVVSSKVPGFRDAEATLASAGLGGKKTGLLAAGKELGKTMVKEGALEELPQSAQEQFFTNVALGRPWAEGVPEAAAQGLVVGAAQGGGMSAASSLMDRAAAKPTHPGTLPVTPPPDSSNLLGQIEADLYTGEVTPETLRKTDLTQFGLAQTDVEPIIAGYEKETSPDKIAAPILQASSVDEAIAAAQQAVATPVGIISQAQKTGMGLESNQFADFLTNDHIDRIMAETPGQEAPQQFPDEVPVNVTPRTIRRPGPTTYPEGQSYTAGKEQAPMVVFDKAYKSPGTALFALKSKAKTLGVNPDDYAVMPDGQGRYVIKTATAQERESLNVIPEPLRPAFRKMKESVLTNDAGGVVKDDEGYLSHRTASTYPDWFKQKPKDKQWQGGWSRDEFNRIVGKVEKGYQLGEKDAERYQELLKVAEHLNNNDHELARNQDVDEMTGRGFEPVYDKVVAADLNKGDKLIADGKEGLPRDEYEVKGVDKQGNIVLQDGAEVRVDPFDQIGVAGLKRGTTKPEDEQGFIEPPKQAGIGSLIESQEQKGPKSGAKPAEIASKTEPGQTVDAQIEVQAHEAATSPLNDRPEPTQAQKEAGNYKMGHVRAHGFGITVENPEGSERKGVDKSGKPWSITMRNHYGYLKGTTGYDKDHLDVFVNPSAPESDTVHVVNQVDPKTGKFDEHKVVFGYSTAEDAKKAYLDNYEPGWKGLKSIVPMSPEAFKEWATGDGTKKGELVGKPAVVGKTTNAPGQMSVSQPESAQTGGQNTGQTETRQQLKSSNIQADSSVKSGDISNDTVAVATPAAATATKEPSSESMRKHNEEVQSSIRAAKGTKFESPGPDSPTAAASELMLNSHDTERPGDVLLAGGDAYASFDDVVALAREGIESGAVRLVPYQLHMRLGLAGRDLARVFEAATTNNTPDASAPAAVETRAPSGVTSSKPAPLTVEDFGEKSIIVRGETKENMERIKGVGILPLWNRRATGWIFHKKHEATVREKLADLLAPVSSDKTVTPKENPVPEKTVATKQPPAPAEQQAVTRESFAKKLERGGWADAPDGTTYSIQHSVHGGYYLRTVKDGIRIEKGGDPRGGGWSMAMARQKAVEAVFGYEYTVKSMQTGRSEALVIPPAAPTATGKTIEKELADSSVDDLMAIFDEVAGKADVVESPAQNDSGESQEKIDERAAETYQKFKSEAGNRPETAKTTRKGMGLHVIQFPGGKYGYAGSIPNEIGYEDGATAEQIEQGKQFGARFGPKERIFDSREDAVSYADSKGYEVKPAPEKAVKEVIPVDDDRFAEKERKARSRTGEIDSITTGSFWDELTPAGKRQMAESVTTNPKEVERISKTLWQHMDDKLRLTLQAAARSRNTEEEVAPVKSASVILGNAAKSGVKGAEESLKGLYELFGGGSLKSFPGGIDKDTYVKAKPHFDAAFKNFQEAGKGIKEFFQFLVDNFSSSIRPYVKAWLEEKKGAETVDNVAENADSIGTGKSLNGGENHATLATATEEKPAEDDRGLAGAQRSEGIPEDEGGRDSEGVSSAEGRSDDRGVRRPGGSGEGEASQDGSAASGGSAGSLHRPGSGVANRARKSSGVTDYRIAEAELTRQGSWRETARRNLDIIELVKKLDAEGRQASKEEQALLAQYTGFGASEIANNLFPGYAQYGEIKAWKVKEGWGDLVERVQNLLTPEELRTAAKSTQYAHYTSEKVIRSIYNALERFGFPGGKIIEPGSGSSSFFGLIPDSMYQASRYTGIEMDHVTAAIARHLYPQQSILQNDFTQQRFPDNFFDLGIGNPPFSGTVILADPAYKKNRFKLHDYFFAKTIDKVRPGGLLVFVTSRYTMDKLDSKARDYLADRADLLGAIRLPQTAFKQNAGTEVVTDVLFMRKREDGQEAGGLAWKSVAEVTTPEGPTNINEYFVAHPEMVLGTHSLQGSMYRTNEYTVLPLDGDIEAHFAEAVKHLPEKVYSIIKRPSQEQREVVAERDFNPKIKKEGSLYLSDKGSLMEVEDGAGKAVVRFSAKEIAWLRDYVPLRDAVKQAQYDQLHDLDWEKSLKALNRAYDAFVKKHGKIQEFTATEKTEINDDGDEVTFVSKRYKNKKVLKADVESYVVEVLEKETEDGIVKGPFLTGRTIKKPVRQTPKTIGDALALTLDEIGVLDLDHVAASLGISREEAIDSLGDQIYENPSTGKWETADEYLSGYVVDKLEEAEVAAKNDPRYARNRDALLKAQPAPLTAKDVHVTLGAPWVDPQYISDFASDVLDLELAANYTASANHWAVGLTRGGKQSNRGGTSEWGTDKRGANEILESVLNNRSLKVTKEVANPNGKGTKAVTDEEATAKVNDIARKMRQRFSAWVWEDAKRAGKLLDSYNRKYNNIAPRKFDGSHLTLPGVSLLFNLHAHQKRAIWRAIQDGNAYFAHAVGSGKTIEMIAAGMEMKRLGMIQKPMYAVPKHMLQQFANEFMELYPLANIMVADEENFHTDNRRRFMTQAALNNPDAIIVTHPSIAKIGMQKESVAVVQNQMIADLREALADLEDDKQGNRILIKKVEKRIEQLEQMFAGMTAGNKDQVMNFEEMGIDFLFVDEAHEFRKLDFVTNRQAKGIDSNGSMKAIDLYIKTKWLESQRPGRSHIFASGTPITNTMGEIYTMMRFFMEKEMDDDGIRHFDAWASMFGEIAPGFERNAAGNYEVIERFAKFVNVPELMKRVRSFMDVLTFTDLGATVTRPDIEGGIPTMVLAPQSDDMARYLKETLAERIRISKKWKPSKEQPGNPDPIINIITDGRLASIDMRFVRPGSPNDPNSKLNKMADGIIKSWQDGKDTVYTDPKTEKKEKIKGSTQIVFFNTGFGAAVTKNRGFDARGWMSQRLKEAGIPASDIAWIDDYPTAARKEALFKEMREGKKRILIGSAKKMGTGLNVQRRLKALHYLDAPWYPADVEQPHGRILRQGNLNEIVNIFWYATEGSYDSTMWQMVARKSKFIEQALSGDDSVRTLEDISESSSYEMATALSSGDSRVIQLAGLHADIERLTRLLRAHHDEQINLQRREGTLQFEIKQTTKRLANYKEAAKTVGGYIRDIAGEIDGTKYDRRKEFGEAVIAKTLEVVAAADGHKQAGVFEVGKLNGFTVAVRVNPPVRPALLMVITKDVKVFVDGDMTPSTDPTGLATRLVNTMNGLGHDVGNIERGLADSKEELAKVTKRIGAPFEYSAELHSKTVEAASLESQLIAEGAVNGNNNPVPSADILVPIDEGIKAEKQARKESGPLVSRTAGKRYSPNRAAAGRSPLYSRASVEPWPADFPKAFSHTTVGKVTGHQDHAAAKAGDLDAARRVVTDTVKKDRVADLAKRFPDAIVVPVVEQEKTGINLIPYALAERYQDAGLKIQEDIYQVGTAKRSGLDAAQRLLARKEFVGKVVKGGKYILVDDILTQGGTIHELRHHIVNNGGEVVGVTSLAFSAGSNIIAIKSSTVMQLAGRFSRGKLERILDEYNISGTIEALTESEGQAALRFKSLDSLRNRLDEASRSLRSQENAGAQSLRSVRQSLTDQSRSTDTTPDQIHAEARSFLKKGYDKLTKLGKLVVHATGEELPAGGFPLSGENGEIVGAYHNGTIHLVADQIADGDTEYVMRHEGLHMLMAEDPFFVGKKKEILGQFEKLRKGSKSVQAVYEQVPDDTAQEHVTEEAYAYFVQNKENHQHSLFKRMIAAVKMWMFRMGIPTTRFTEADFVTLAGQGVKSFANRQATDKESLSVGLSYAPAYSRSEVVRHAKAFYSMLQQITADKFQGMKAQGVVNFLSKHGVKKAEIEATGLLEWLAAKKQTDKVTREELSDFVKANTVELEDVMLGGSIQSNRLTSAEDARFYELINIPGGQWDDPTSDYVGGRDRTDEEEAEHQTLSKKHDRYIAEKNENKTHFSQYQEPGAVEGSYREMFVTAPANDQEIFDLQGKELFVGLTGHEQSRLAHLFEKAQKWQDGHSEYSVIKNPVVRIRFNERNDTEGRRILSIEEMQGPSEGDQAKMPGYLRDNIYNLGVKRILTYAKENGFDGVALATKPGMSAGETQADRYSLAKQVEGIGYAKNNDGTYEVQGFWGDETVITKKKTKPEELEVTVGKSLAKKIVAGEGKQDGDLKMFVGDDLKINDTGLIKLYDETIPAMFEAYGKGKMGIVTVKTGIAQMKAAGEYSDMPFIPITQNTPASFPLFAKQTAGQKEEAKHLSEDRMSVAALVKELQKIPDWTGKKADTTLADRLLSVPLHYFKKVPAMGRMFEAGQRRLDNFHNWLYAITGKPSEGQHLTQIIEDFRKESPVEYEAFGKYLFTTDRTGKGYRIKEEDKPETEDRKGGWLLFDPKGKLVERFDQEHEAVGAMIVREADDFTRKGFSSAATGALVAARQLTNNGFNVLFSSMREVIQLHEEHGVPLPEIVEKDKDGNEITINLKQALREMGDLRGIYMPRIRRPGRVMLMATKDGKNPILEKFDWHMKTEPDENALRHGWRKTFNVLSPAGILARELQKQGYEVRFEASKAMPEDIFAMAGNIVGQQAMINEALARAKEFKGEKVNDLSLAGVEGEWIDRDIGKGKTSRTQKVFAVKTESADRYRHTFMAHNGTFNHKEKRWEFFDIEPQERTGFEQRISRALYHDSVANSIDTRFLFARGIAEQMAEIIRARGFRVHMNKRVELEANEVWLGYEEDASTALAKYAQGIAAGEAKRQLAQELTEAFTGTDVSWQQFKRTAEELGEEASYKAYLALVEERRIDPIHQPNAFRDAKVFMEDMLRNQEASDRIMGALSGAAVLKYLAFRVAAPLVNLTAMATSVPAAMDGIGKLGLGHSFRLLTRAANQYRLVKTGGKSDFKKVFDEISDRGWDDAQFNREALAVLESRVGAAWGKTIEAGMYLFGVTEKFNRAVTIAAAYDGLMKKGGYTHEEAMLKAKEISDNAHGLYGKVNRPHMVRGQHAAAQTARAFYMFKTFPHNYLLTMKRLGLDEKNWKAFAYMLLSPAIFGGAAASMATPLLATIASALGVGGDDPEEGFYAWLQETFGDSGERMGRSGLPGLAGVSLKGSLEIGIMDLPTKTSDLLGAPGSVITDMVTGAGLIARGDVMKGTEKVLPSGFGNILKGYREATEGVTTSGNAPVFYGKKPLVASKVEAGLRMLSFNPARIAGIREKQRKEYLSEQGYSIRKKEIYNRLRANALKPDSARMKKILRMITEYNEDVVGSATPGLTLITRKSIRNMMKRAAKPPKRERMRAVTSGVAN